MRVRWNAYPFWLAHPQCPTTKGSVDRLCAEFLRELADLLEQTIAVVLVGDPAAESWRRLAKKGGGRLTQIEAFAIPHPSHGWWGKPYKGGLLSSEVVDERLRAVADLVGATT